MTRVDGVIGVRATGGWSRSSQGVVDDVRRGSGGPGALVETADVSAFDRATSQDRVARSRWSNNEVADKVGCNQATVVKRRKRFIERGLDGLPDDPRPGTPRSITDDDVEALIVRTLEDKPTDATHWSTRDLAAKSGMSPSSVGRIWRAFGLKPWLTDTFKLSEDPQFVDKVRDVVGLYMNPPEHAVVMCVDGKTSLQALDRTQPSLPMRPGQIERRTHDYKRHGVTDLFAALNLAAGQVVHQTRAQHRAIEFRKFLDLINDTVPADLAVHVVLDNSSTHKTPAIHDWQLKHPRFTFHFTPTSSSWMNLVERLFAELTTRCSVAPRTSRSPRSPLT